MRKYFTLMMALLLFGSCNRDGDVGMSSAQGEYGNVLFASSIDSSVDAVTRSSSTVEIVLPDSILPTTADFLLEITGDYIDPDLDGDAANGTYNLSYKSIDECNNSSLALLETQGDNKYTAKVSSGDSTAEGEYLPCFGGETEFSVEARATNSVSVTASLTNSLFELSTSEWFDNYYTSAEFIITTSAGNSFTFSSGEDSPMIFVEAGTTLTLEGSATKSNGYDVTFAPNVIGVTSAGEFSSIVVDASQAGSASITIEFNTEFTSIEEVSHELNELK